MIPVPLHAVYESNNRTIKPQYKTLFHNAVFNVSKKILDFFKE